VVPFAPADQPVAVGSGGAPLTCTLSNEVLSYLSSARNNRFLVGTDNRLQLSTAADAGTVVQPLQVITI
jgi:hypothetical protein